MKKEPKLAKHKANTKDSLKLVDNDYVQNHKKYKNFAQLNGNHPWMDQVPEGYIAYKVRSIENAKLTYFNFDLAKEMGLIPQNHEHKLSKELEKVVLDTFAIQIINEFDIENNKKFDPKTIKPNLYMATRYLQLQHPNKQGKTSGDGRSIWNGTVKSKTACWDVSSRGTGVTALAPGIILSGKNLETGNEDYGYGCGLAEIDELYATALMSEIFHANKIPTERTLAVIETGDLVGIGVRAGKNLLRPAHLFAFLKQGKIEPLKRAMNYFIDRQNQNAQINYTSKSSTAYEKTIKHIAVSYAQFAARLESDYIFAWFDWDGDNMLMDIGILDYGSIRQFGLRHDEYRYDDIERFSTNLNEQKTKSRLIVQVFAQLLDFLTSESKKPITEFNGSEYLEIFDQEFEKELNLLFLEKLGFNEEQRKKVIRYNSNIFNDLKTSYEYIEKKKADNKAQKVDDGVNRHPQYNTRKLLQYIANYFTDDVIETEEEYFNTENLHKESCSEYAIDKDLDANSKKHFQAFIECYFKLIETFQLTSKGKKVLFNNVKDINHMSRITGNSITYVVNELLDHRHKKLKVNDIQAFIELFIYNQAKLLNDDYNKNLNKLPKTRMSKEFLKEMLYIVEEFSEEI